MSKNVLRFRKKRIDPDTDEFQLVSDEAVRIDISSLIEGPLFDLAVTELLTPLDERMAEQIGDKLEWLDTDHTYHVHAHLYAYLAYDVDKGAPNTVTLELPYGVSTVPIEDAVLLLPGDEQDDDERSL